MTNETCAQANNKREYFYGFDCIRVLLTIIVVFSHSGGYFYGMYSENMRWIISHFSGANAVSVFFILSGFCTANSIKQMDNFLGGGQQDIEFFKIRWKRNWLVYLKYFIIICVISLIMQFDCTGGTTIMSRLMVFVIHLFMLQSIAPTGKVMLAYSSTAWFLSCLVILYFFAPKVYRLFSRYRRQSKYIIGIFYVVALVVVSVFYNRCTNIIYATPIIRVIEFSIGIYAYRVKENVEVVNYIECKQLGSLMLLVGSFVLIRYIPALCFKELLVMCIPAVVCIYYFSYKSKITQLIEKNKLIHLLSEEAIGVYLLHYFLIEIVATYFQNYNGMLLTGGVIFLSYAISYMVSKVDINYAIKRKVVGKEEKYENTCP